MKPQPKGVSTGNWFVMVFVVCCLMVPSPVMAAKSPDKVRTKVKHKPIKYFVSGSRIEIKAKVRDPSGVSLVRCYFKGTAEADYVFVELTSDNGKQYQGLLPAPGENTEMIDYLFLVVNGNRQVVRTQSYQVEKKDKKYTPGWQQAKTDQAVQVYSELPNPPSMPPGFSDSVTMDVVESAFRFGFVVAGIYTLDKIGETGGSGALAGSAASGGTTAAAAGTITATAGLSTAAVVGLTAGAIAAGAGAAGAAGGGSDDDHGGRVDDSDLQGASGEVRVNLQWSNCDDLDLHVKDPCGVTIYYRSRIHACDGKTGALDVDANSRSCSDSPAENIYWEDAPRGTYTVHVNHYRGTHNTAYQVTVITGSDRKEFSGTISPDQFLDITTFTY
ncbi:MAG: hypothetical protein CSA22_02475 [Deltaproteobacteria bacterium]|nr:MAG: hypothetical protein CSA22_02475 [Deltaproteobacteria bacterium]